MSIFVILIKNAVFVAVALLVWQSSQQMHNSVLILSVGEKQR